MKYETLKLTAAAAAAAVTFSAAPALSATFYVDTQDQTGNHSPFNDATDSNALVQSINVGGLGTVSAGLFRLTATDAGGTGDFLAFCLQPFETLRLPRNYDVATDLGVTAIGQIGALVTNAFGLVNNSEAAAAFQAAVWEIANDSGLDLGAGAFTATDAGGAVELAQEWLDEIALGNWDPVFSGFTLLQAANTQDLVGIGGGRIPNNPPGVPLPAAGWMMIAGVASIAGLRRRKKA